MLLEYLGLYTAFQHPQTFQQSHIHHVDVVILEANGYKNERPSRQKRERVLFHCSAADATLTERGFMIVRTKIKTL